MTKTIIANDEKIVTLTTKAVINLHNLLSENYEIFSKMEPISPSGVKNIGLLESAVNRQNTGIDKYYKYDTIYSNCATLTFGIAKNHAFHNGNKRTALLSLIKHLYANGYVLKPSLKDSEIYDLILSTVNGDLKKHFEKYSSNNESFNFSIEDESTTILYLAFWIKKNAIHKKNYTASQMKMKDFRKILDKKSIRYEEKGRHILLSKYRTKYLFKKELICKHKYYIGPSKTVIKKRRIEQIRKDFELTFSDGIDNVTFYNDDYFINDEIKNYKSIIYRLSKT